MSMILIAPAQTKQLPHNDIIVGSTFGASMTPPDVFSDPYRLPPADRDRPLYSLTFRSCYISDVIAVNPVKLAEPGSCGPSIFTLAASTII
jgi:hypothetical protein